VIPRQTILQLWVEIVKYCLAFALVGSAISFALPISAQQTGTPPAPAATAIAQQDDTVDPKIAQVIRLLAVRFDEAFNNGDAVTVATFYTDDAVYTTADGTTYNGRQAIESKYALLDFQHDHCTNLLTKVDRVIAIGDEVGSIGTWGCAFQWNGDTKHVEGHYSTVLVREGDTWKIRKSKFDKSKTF
jgi:uncharacterized protein (TIGR02246 family)